MAMSQQYMNALARRLREGTLEGQALQNAQINWDRGAFSPEQMQTLSGQGMFNLTEPDPMQPAPPQTAQGYLDHIGWDGTTDRFGRNANTIAFDQGEYGVTLHDGISASRDELRTLNNAMNQWASDQMGPVVVPDMNGMGRDGRQRNPDNVDDFGSMLLAPPEDFDPVYNRPDAGGGNPGMGGPVDSSWDWARVNQTPTGGFGDYFYNYDASERYSPGRDATWGSENFPGDNRDFYQNQFGNLLRQEQNFQEAQRQAAALRQEAMDQPAPALDNSWDWAYGGQGLPEVVVSDGYDPVGESAPDWILNPAYDIPDGVTNQGLTSLLAPYMSQKSQDVWRQHWANPNTNRDGTFLGGAGSPEVVRDAWFADQGGAGAPKGSFRDAINELLDLTYVNQNTLYGVNTPQVAVGYANPIPQGGTS